MARAYYHVERGNKGDDGEPESPEKDGITPRSAGHGKLPLMNVRKMIQFGFFALATTCTLPAGGLGFAQPSLRGFRRSVEAVNVTAAPALAAQDPSRQKAITDLKEMAEGGDVKSQVRLGLIYATGDGVARNDTEAVKWFRKAADQDNAMGERYLAEMYFKGRGVPADNDEAVKWLRLAAEQDDAESEHNLAVMYVQGLGVPRNTKEAVKWMRRSAEQGLAAGQLGLGALYENGDGVQQDFAEAASWYRKAVEKNNTDAMNNLALLLATTSDAKLRNPQEAVTLASKAVAAANRPDYLDTLAAAYFAAGQTDKAIEAEKKALALSPGDETYTKALADYMAAAGSR